MLEHTTQPNIEQIIQDLSEKIPWVRSTDELVHVLAEPAVHYGVTRVSLYYFITDENDIPVTAELVAFWSTDSELDLTAGTVFQLRDYPFAEAWRRQMKLPFTVSDLNEHSIQDRTVQLLRSLNISALVYIPLMLHDNVVGVLSYSWPDPHIFTEDEKRLYHILSGLASPAVENRRQIDLQQNEQLEKLFQLSRNLNRTRSEQDVLEVLAAELSELGDMMMRLSYFDTDSEGHPVHARLVAIWPPNARQYSPLGSVFPMGISPDIMGPIVQDNFFQISDATTNPNMPPFLREIQRYYNHEGLVLVPLQTGGRLIGILSMSWPDNQSFSMMQRRLLYALSDMVAPVVDNLQLVNTLEERVAERTDALRLLSKRLVEVQEAERRRIAHELHDEIGQVLTSLKMTLEMAANLPDGDMPRFKGHIRNAAESAAGLIQQVSDLSLDLRPAILDDYGLTPALRWLFSRYSDQTGILIDFKQNISSQRYPTSVEISVYRIIQEALTNIARHSQSQHAEVWLYATGDHLTLQIQDSGKGFDVEAVLHNQRSLGLIGLMERAKLIGANLNIQSQPGEGSSILLNLQKPYQ